MWVRKYIAAKAFSVCLMASPAYAPVYVAQHAPHTAPTAPAAAPLKA